MRPPLMPMAPDIFVSRVRQRRVSGRLAAPIMAVAARLDARQEHLAVLMLAAAGDHAGVTEGKDCAVGIH